MSGNLNPWLHDPDQAISAYLETLLDPHASGIVASVDPASDRNPEPAEKQDADEWASVCALQVDGLRLLLPMSRIDAVIPAETRIPVDLGEPFRGILVYRERRAICVHLAALIKPVVLDRCGQDPSCAVLIGNGRWALLCDSVQGDLSLDPASVQWRSRREGEARPWLTGTSRALRSVLLDADELTGWLWPRLRGKDTAKAS